MKSLGWADLLTQQPCPSEPACLPFPTWTGVQCPILDRDSSSIPGPLKVTRRLMLPPSACPSRQEIRTHLYSGIYKSRNSGQSPGRGPEPKDHVSTFIFLRRAKRDVPSRTVQTFKLWIQALGAGKLSQNRGYVMKLGPEYPLHRRGNQGLLASGHTMRKGQRLS